MKIGNSARDLRAPFGVLVLGATSVAVGIGLVIATSSGAAATCDKTFKVTAGSWQVAGNWMPSGVPATTHYACIPSGRTATLGAAATVRGIEVTGTLSVSGAGSLTLTDPVGTSASTIVGTVDGNGSLTQASGTLAVVDGYMEGNGTTTVAAGAAMTVTGPGDGLTLDDNRVLAIDGTLTVTGTTGGSSGDLYMYGGASIIDGGMLDLANGGDLSGSGTVRVAQSGVLRSTTAGTSVVGPTVELAGRIEPIAGTLTLGTTVKAAAGGSITGMLSAAGGALKLPSTIDVAAGSKISTEGTGVTLSGTVLGAGEFNVAGGTLAATDAYMEGAGTTTVTAGATLAVTGSGDGLTLDDTRVLTNNGTLTVTGTSSGTSGDLYSYAGTGITNNGLLQLLADGDISGSGNLTNTTTGTITKPTGTGVSTVSAKVDNDGTVSAAAGSLEVNGSGTPSASSGTFAAATPSANVLVGGVVLTNGAQLVGPATGLGAVTVAGSTVTIPVGATATASGRTGLTGTLDGAGELVVASGTFAAVDGYMEGNGTTTVASGAAMTVTGSGDGLTLDDNRVLAINGTLTVTGTSGGSSGDLYAYFGASVLDNGELDLANGGDLSGAGTLRVTPTGLVRSTTAGTSVIASTVELAGRIEPTAGSLTLSNTVKPGAGGSLTGVLSAAGGALKLPSTIDVAAGSKISTEGTGVTLTGTVLGAGEFKVAAGTLAATGPYMDGAGTTIVTAGATLAVTGSGDGLTLDDTRQLTNNGNLTVTGTSSGSSGGIYTYSGTGITNNGQLQLLADGDISGGGNLTNTTTGTITKPTGTGVSTVSNATDNSGTVESDNGRLEFTGAFAAQSGATLTKGIYRAVSPGVVRLPNNISTNQATIVLDGVNAKLESSSGASGLAGLNVNSGSLTAKGGKVLAVGALANSGTVEIGPIGASKIQPPSYTQSGGTTTLRDATSTLATTGTTTFTGGLVGGVGTVQAGGTGVIANGTALIEPGLAGPGTLSVAGNLSLASGSTLAVDVDGTGAGQADRLTVSGTATLSGTLEIDNGYAAALPDDITVVTCGTACNGSPAAVLGADLPGFLSWHVDRLATSVHLRVAQPVVSVTDATITEPDAGTTNMLFTLTLSEPTSASQSVSVSTADGTATDSGPGVADDDYNAVAGTVTFAPEQTTATVSVPIVGDGVYEHDETFSMGVTSSDLVVGDDTATGTIQNDESVPALSVSAASVVEGDVGTPAFAVNAVLSVPSAFASSATWTTADCTAAAGSDYTSTGGSVSFVAGSTSVRLSPSPQALGDLVTESDETITVAFSDASPPGDLVLAGPGCNLTIIDDDAAISVQSGSATEGDSGTAPLMFTVNLSHPNPRPVMFSWSTSAGTALPGSDYVQVIGATGSVPAGSTSAMMSVSIIGDLASESTEAFDVTLSGISGGQPGTPLSAAMTIFDNDTVAPCTRVGTAGNDTISGTDGNDVYCGLDGNDTFLYSSGNDTFWGGALGVETGGGNDTIVYSAFGAGGSVDAQLLTGEIVLWRPAGTVFATQTEHAVENITGSPGDDLLRGDHGVNKIKGGAGDDILSGYDGNDDIDGGADKDTASYFNATGGVTVNMSSSAGPAGVDALHGIDRLIGSEFNDTLTGDAGANTLSGLAGDDVLNAGSGNDTVLGHGGADTINAGPGNDTAYGDAPPAVIHGTVGADTVRGDVGDDKLFGDGGNDAVYGDDGKDVVHGDDGKDIVLDGGPGDSDKVYGDAGAETVASIIGGDGAHDICKQGGPSDPVGLPGPGCENDVSEPGQLPPADVPPLDAPSAPAVRED